MCYLNIFRQQDKVETIGVNTTLSSIILICFSLTISDCLNGNLTETLEMASNYSSELNEFGLKLKAIEGNLKFINR